MTPARLIGKDCAAEVLDVQDLTISPGFIDVHIHGAVGHDVNASTAEELLEVAAFLAKNGVTSWMPTMVPDSDENYERIIGEIDRLMELQEGKAVAQSVGVHYEGVFANEAMLGLSIVVSEVSIREPPRHGSDGTPPS